MDIYQITLNDLSGNQTYLNNFEEAYYDSTLLYSMDKLIMSGLTSKEEILVAFHKAIQICSLAGINPRHHYRHIYVYDERTGNTETDWLISRKGLHLIMMECPTPNIKIANWLWELLDQQG